MAGRFSQEFINKVIDAADIVQVISKHTHLAKKGARYMGVCPFHSEKTPSFSVNADRQLYYCFGCGAGGNVVGFVMDMYKYTFPEAIEYLATQANIPLEYEEGGADASGVYQTKKLLYQINRDAARYFYANFQKSEKAKDYIKKRGLSGETVQTFAIGWAPNAFNGLYRYLKTKKYTDEQLLLSSLVRKGNNGFYDYFRERVMFPIMDASDNIVAFGGRVLDNSQPKYLNSPETPVFLKHNTLFNLNRAKKSLTGNPLIIVEGYMDVIALYDKGVPNACATLGTALSASHAKLILRYTDNAVLCYDGDTPGRNAAVRGADILTEGGLEPKVLLLPGGEDPDSYITKFGKEAFEAAVSQGVYAADFKIRELAQKYKLDDIVQRARFLKEAAEAVAKIDDEIKWDYYVKILSNMTDTEPAVVKKQIHKSRSEPSAARAETDGPVLHKRELKGVRLAQTRLLKYVMSDYDNYAEFSQAGGSAMWFPDDDLREIYEEVEKIYSENVFVDIFTSIVYNNKIAHTLALIQADENDINGEEARKYLTTLMAHAYNEEAKKVKKQIADTEKSCSEKEMELLMKQYTYLKKKLLELKSGGDLID